MTLKTADRVFETSTTTGTGTLTLQGPVAGFQSFVTGVGNGAKVPYTITQADAFGVIVSWECGTGTVTDAASDTLSRTTVLRSSYSNAPVNFGSGTKNVYLGFIADVVPTRDENLNFIEGFGVVAGTANALTLTLPVVPKGYSDGMTIKGFATNANTAGATTINVNSLGSKNIKVNGADPAANVLTNGGYFEAVYKSASGWFELRGTLPVASDTVAGIIEIATDAEFRTGTATDRGTTPANVKAGLGFTKIFESAEQTVTNNTVVSVAHSLGAFPKLVMVTLRAKNAVLGFSVGDEVPLAKDNDYTNGGASVGFNATNIWAGVNNAPFVQRKDNGLMAQITLTDWRFVMRAWA
ncbi:hypothetical protein [Dyadobacter bucti]|uniref:hypothetical protein n=1 Tax=Dyadobacter bucti TaxID=2572203 RepID=UPI0011083159|nr:hypothetical protein [Dyadobacter bucti]